MTVSDATRVTGSTSQTPETGSSQMPGTGQAQATPGVDAPAVPGGGGESMAVSQVAEAVWNRLAPWHREFGLLDVAVGAAFEIEDAAAGLLAGLRRRIVFPAHRPMARLGLLLSSAQEHAARLAERGITEEERGRRRASAAIESLMTMVATAAVVDRAVDAQVERLLRPLVASVLDDILSQLANEPERVQALVRAQRDSMVSDLIRRVRESTTAGDTAVDRLTTKLIRRTPEDPGADPASATG